LSEFVLSVEDESQYDSILDSAHEVVVRFTAEWCGPCKQFAPHYDKAAEVSDATFLVVDIDKAPWAVSRYSIMGVPTTKVFRNGEFVADVARTPATRTAIKFLDEIKNV
jgi:thioredoxin 1